jgi:hypothetical protein
MSEQNRVPETPEVVAAKDRFFESVGQVGEEMIAAFGKEFAIGVFVLAARFIAEGKQLRKPAPAAA